MEFRTKVKINKPDFEIEPFEDMLFVGSCFADNIGKKFVEEKFNAIVNPYGVMYNPASILHTVVRTEAAPRVALFTLGTNHVYILNETGEIVDNCAKRPQRLFTERELSIEECVSYLSDAVDKLTERNSDVRIIVTVSPIRYAKYGYHESQLSKATLLLAADMLVKKYDGRVIYFPASRLLMMNCATIGSMLQICFIRRSRPLNISGNCFPRIIFHQLQNVLLKSGGR